MRRQPGEDHGARVANSSSLTWTYNGVWCTPPAQPAQAAEAAWMEDTEAADLHTHGKKATHLPQAPIQRSAAPGWISSHNP
jgi:hypothetical protein